MPLPTINERRDKTRHEEDKLSELRTSIASLRDTLASLEIQECKAKEGRNERRRNERRHNDENFFENQGYGVPPKAQKPMGYEPVYQENFNRNMGSPPLYGGGVPHMSMQGGSPPIPMSLILGSPTTNSFGNVSPYLQPMNGPFGSAMSVGTSSPYQQPLGGGFLNSNPHQQNFQLDPHYPQMVPSSSNFSSPNLRPNIPNFDQFMAQTTDYSTLPPQHVQAPKSKVCRHFLRGYCKMGELCKFTHAIQTAFPSDQIIFLGGIPNGVSGAQLAKELNEKYDVNVTDQPQIVRNFAPRVALETKEQAAKLVRLESITLFDIQVDVRPFQDTNKTEAEMCMVFLGGLPDDVDVQRLKIEMFNQGFEVLNKPKLGQGYARNVQLSSAEKANDLIRKKVIVLFDQIVDVRPYVNIYAEKLLRRPAQYYQEQQYNNNYQ